jgi:hypothetical protein
VWLPVDIEVPTNLQAGPTLQYGPLRGGPAGQYYSQFRGYLLRQWSPPQPGRREVFGSFKITGLQTLNGTWETMNYTISLSATPLPPYQP